MAKLASPKIWEGSKLTEGKDGELGEDEGEGGQLGEGGANPGAVEEDDEEAGNAAEGSWRRCGCHAHAVVEGSKKCLLKVPTGNRFF